MRDALIGGRHLLLPSKSDGLNGQLFNRAVVRRCCITVCTKDVESVLVHASEKHGVCLEQLKTVSQRRIGVPILSEARFSFLLAHGQVAGLKQTPRMVVSR